MKSARIQGVISAVELENFRQNLKSFSEWRGSSQSSGAYILEALRYYNENSEFSKFLNENKK